MTDAVAVRRFVFAAAIMLASMPALAGFDEVVHAVEAKTGLHREWMPGLGLARFVVWCVRPHGVSDFQLATFEGHSDRVDGDELGRLVAANAGRGFQPLVRTWSRRDGEWTYIFARPSGSGRVELLIATRDKTDTVVVRTVLNADRIAADIDQPNRLVTLAEH